MAVSSVLQHFFDRDEQPWDVTITELDGRWWFFVSGPRLLSWTAVIAPDVSAVDRVLNRLAAEIPC